MVIAVGIDLGTTNSCVAVVQGKRAKVVTDRNGERIQPSIISLSEEGSILAGAEAKGMVVSDPENTMYSFKRMLGRDIDTPELKSLINDFSYKVEKGPDNIPVVKIRDREISLPEISAMMLKHLKDMCTENLGTEIKDAVITVPANFNDLQRSFTKIAGRIAGFNVLRILNEPTAAALAYGFGGQLTERIAVYDFGGGTFDITIIELMDDIFEVLSTAGDTYLGGDDFDNVIVQEMLEQFKAQHKQELTDDPIAMQRVRTVAERIKCQLSSLPIVQATLRDIIYKSNGKGVDFSFSLSRDRLELLIGPLIDRSLDTCKEALKLAKMDYSELDNLIMVGGTTRIPLVRRKVAEYFDRKPKTEINPDEVVAIGAAIHAYSLTGEALPDELKAPPSNVKMNDRTGLSNIVRTSKIPNQMSPQILPMPSGQGQPKQQQALQHTSTQPPPAQPLQKKLLGQPTIIDPSKQNLPMSVDEDIWGDISEPATSSVSNDEREMTTETALLDSDLVQHEEPPQPPPVPPAMKPVKVTKPHARDTDSFDEPMNSISSALEPDAAPLDMSDFGNIGINVGYPKQDAEPVEKNNSDRAVVSASKDHVDGEGDQNKFDESRKSFSINLSAAPVKTLLLDVTPRALGVGTAGGYCDVVIERNAAIPVEQSRIFSTSRNDQTEVAINIYQGESRRVEDNVHLGRIELTEIRSAARGEIKIRVTFEINTDGILAVSALNEETGQAQATNIVLAGGLDDDQINELVKKYSEK